MKKIDNQMIGGILLIAFALVALAIALLWGQRNGSSAGRDSGRSANTTADTPIADNGSSPTSADAGAEEVVEKDENNGASNNSEPEPEPVASLDSWLGYVNSVRASAGIPLVVEDSALSNAARLHAAYVVVNDNFSHREDPNLPNYTPEGNQAAQDGLIFATSNTAAGFSDSVGFWASGPFHLVPMLNPRLDKMGYGNFVDAGDPNVKMSGILNLGPRNTHGGNEDVYPVMYPGDGKTTQVLSQTLPEWPDAMGHCGFSRPVGAPIVLMIGTGDQTPNVGNFSVMQNGSAIEVCMFNETNFNGSDDSQRTTGRRILDSLDAVVLIPRSPLQAGATYTVNLEVNGVGHNWSFETR